MPKATCTTSGTLSDVNKIGPTNFNLSSEAADVFTRSSMNVTNYISSSAVEEEAK
jgi:hypothetical protein